MKKGLKAALAMVLILTVLFCFTACSPSVVGLWSVRYGSTQQLVELRADSMVFMQGEYVGYYSVDGDRLTIFYTSGSNVSTDVYTFVLNGDSATVFYSDGVAHATRLR